MVKNNFGYIFNLIFSTTKIQKIIKYTYLFNKQKKDCINF